MYTAYCKMYSAHFTMYSELYYRTAAQHFLNLWSTSTSTSPIGHAHLDTSQATRTTEKCSRPGLYVCAKLALGVLKIAFAQHRFEKWRKTIHFIWILVLPNLSIFSSLIKDLTKCAFSSRSLVCNLINRLTTLFFQVFPFPVASFLHFFVQNLFLL